MSRLRKLLKSISRADIRIVAFSFSQILFHEFRKLSSIDHIRAHSPRLYLSPFLKEQVFRVT